MSKIQEYAMEQIYYFARLGILAEIENECKITKDFHGYAKDQATEKINNLWALLDFATSLL